MPTSKTPEFNRQELMDALALGLQVLQWGSPITQQSMLDTLNTSEAFRFFVASSKKVQ